MTQSDVEGVKRMQLHLETNRPASSSADTLGFPSDTFVRAHGREELICKSDAGCFNAFKWGLNYVMVIEVA